MNKFQKIFLLCFLFSYVFSVKILKIKPTTVNFGESVDFTLTVDYFDFSELYKINRIYLSNEGDETTNHFECFPSNYTIIDCTANIHLYEKEDLTNLTKTLFMDDENTNLVVKIQKPKSLKLLYFENEQYFYFYGVSSIKFYVNLNELYKPDFSIKFGKYSITNCSLDKESIFYLLCYYEFPKSSNKQTLKLKFGNEDTNDSITIKTPDEFSRIKDLDIKNYYVSSSEQYVYFYVDFSYKMNDHKFILVPENSTNKNITLSKCTYYNIGLEYGKCSGILNKIDSYYVFVDNKNTTLKLFVYPVPTAIARVYEIEPEKLLIPSSATTFTLKVDYIVNLDKAVFTLVNEYDDTNKVYLTKCKKVKNSISEIKCVGKIKNSGKYYVYLNGIKQTVYVTSLISSLSKALYVSPKVIKYELNNIIDDELDGDLFITIYFDSMRDFSSKKIELKGNDNNVDIFGHIIEKTSSYVSFLGKNTLAVDTYHVYIDGVKQDASIIVTNEESTSKVTAISPTLVNYREDIYIFTLTVDTNLGVEDSHFILKKKNNNYEIILNCEDDFSDKTKAICLCRISVEGEYYVKIENGTEFKDVTVTVKNIPSPNSFYPISFSPSSIEQTITLTFTENIASYVDKVKFVGTETVEAKCSTDSIYVLYCSAVFTNEDDYYITIDGANIGKYINVNEDDNINKGKDENINNSVNYLKISSLLLTLLLLF